MNDFDDIGANGYLSTSGSPEPDYEPDDSDTAYYDTWEEAEEVAARMVANAEKWQAELVSQD